MRRDDVQQDAIERSSRHKSFSCLLIIASGHNVLQGTFAWPFGDDTHIPTVSISAEVPVACEQTTIRLVITSTSHGAGADACKTDHHTVARSKTPLVRT